MGCESKKILEVLRHRVEDVADLAVYRQTIFVLDADCIGEEVRVQLRHQIGEHPPRLLVGIPRVRVAEVFAQELVVIGRDTAEIMNGARRTPDDNMIMSD